jgi:GNAT superfamily N-acetyltransferase
MAQSTIEHRMVRGARPDEAAHLTALGLRSKAYWGYDAAFMAACVPSLTVTQQQIAASDERYFVAEDAGGTVQGYAALRVRLDDAELTSLFVEPDAIGQGYGKALWDHTVEVARSVGATRMQILADPFAEAFYLRQGARRIGEAPSDAIPGRTLPHLTFTIAPLSDA